MSTNPAPPPVEVGTAIAVATQTELGTLDASHMNPGTTVFVTGDNTQWQLEVSVAAIGAGVIAVSGITGYRWIEQGGSSGFVTLAQLASTTVTSGGTLVGINNPAARYDQASLQGILDSDAIMKVDLAASDGTGGTSLIATQNTGGYANGTHALETYLQTLGASACTAIEAKFRTIASAHLGANFSFAYDEFDALIGAITAAWSANGSVAKSTVYPTAVQMAGVTADLLYKAEAINIKTDKWFIGGVMKISSTAGAGDVKGFSLDSAAGHPPTNGVVVGFRQAASATKFSAYSIVASAVTASALSTVNFDNNAHVFYMWSDGTQVKFSVDFETEVLLTNTMTTLVNGGSIFNIIGVQSAAATNAVQFGCNAFGHGFAT